MVRWISTKTFRFFFTILFFFICIAFAALGIGYLVSLPYVHILGPDSNLLGYLGALALVFVVFIPLLAITLYIAKHFTPFKVSYTLKQNLFVPWLIALGAAIGIGITTFKDYQAYSSTSSIKSIDLQTDQALDIRYNDLGYDNYIGIVQMGHLKYYDKKLYNKDVRAAILPSDTDQAYIETVSKSRGSSTKKAQNLLSQINSNVSVAENSVLIDKMFYMGTKPKYRGQEIDHNIYLPEGTLVNMSYYDGFYNSKFAEDVSWNDKAEVKQWKMTSNGLVPQRTS